jgi:hypothetical protein
MRFTALFLLLLLARGSSAQQIGLYDRILDPLAIAYLGGPDSLPPEQIDFVHGGFELDADGYRRVADVKGPGIITHFWVTYPSPLFDSSAFIKVYIDDSLVYDGKLVAYFKGYKRHRYPLSAEQSGSLVSDVQVPFRSRFRMTYKGHYSFVAISWRRVPNASLITSYDYGDTTGSFEQERAESVFALADNQGSIEGFKRIEHSLSIQRDHVKEIFTSVGKGIIRSVRFKPESFEFASYKDLWLTAYWDGLPQPFIDLPVADLFGATTDYPYIDALQLKVDSTEGMRLLLPMPFKNGARIILTNKGTEARSIFAELLIDTTERDLTNYGRLTIQFNDQPHPKYFHLLNIASAKGRGRAVGVVFNMPESPEPYYLEGDPFIVIDSSNRHTIHYPGTEDYFNGGWYFRDGAFSLPFAGCPVLYNTLYRFHYLDAINFSTSLDWKWQHGRQSDYDAYYRSVSFLYLEARDFWVRSDTIHIADDLDVGGRGYTPHAPITIAVGEKHFSTQSDATGSFRFSVRALALGEGIFNLRVEDIALPEPIVVVKAPVVEWTADSQYTAFSMLDSIAVQLRGFASNEAVILHIGQHSIGKLVSDLRGVVHGTLRIPDLPAGFFPLLATSSSREGVARQHVEITKKLRYEVEELLPALDSSFPHTNDYLGWWPWTRWSNSRILFVYPPGPGHEISLPLIVPQSDTFAVELVTNTGLRYADLEVSINDQYLGTIECFLDTAFGVTFPSPRILLGSVFMHEGQNRLSFRTSTRNPKAVEWSMGPDVLFITPLPRVSGPGKPVEPERRIWVAQSSDGAIIRATGLPPHEELDVEIYDILGRKVAVERLLIPGSGAIDHPVAGALASKGRYSISCSIGGQVVFSGPVTKL